MVCLRVLKAEWIFDFSSRDAEDLLGWLDTGVVEEGEIRNQRRRYQLFKDRISVSDVGGVVGWI